MEVAPCCPLLACYHSHKVHFVLGSLFVHWMEQSTGEIQILFFELKCCSDMLSWLQLSLVKRLSSTASLQVPLPFLHILHWGGPCSNRWGRVKQTGFGIITIALAAAFSVIPTLAHQTPAEQSWRLWLSPALHEHTFESHGRKPTPVLCSLITPFPVPELCRKKGWKKWKQLVGSETKSKLSG